MEFESFSALFRRATGNPNPFPYQTRFAEADEIPDLIHAPTGAGKTATAILGWVWRYFHTKKATPLRLVYCLPMRVLVEQTRDEARKWLENIGLKERVGVHVLMGGEEAAEWDLEPEKPAVLIGTQDMLLSRALNRGYGMGRFRWPMHFGLLNNPPVTSESCPHLCELYRLAEYSHTPGHIALPGPRTGAAQHE